jgi:hypothetical protein
MAVTDTERVRMPLVMKRCCVENKVSEHLHRTA